jgi:glycosyltransferase involved in cell wall biosynthesis
VETASPPLVSVVLAARDAGGFLTTAVRSILRQTVRDLELVVVDDGSRDDTPVALAALDDPRLVLLRNDEPTGLSAALNLGFSRARARYVARMDADDVALPFRLERQLERLDATPAVAIVGSGVTELDEADRLGRTHVQPAGVFATRWASLFGTPFFHPSVVVDRELLERQGLLYDSGYDAGDASTEDYELWSRLLAVADGDNIPEPLLLYRRHSGQASARRAEHQLELRRQIAVARILEIAPDLGADAAALAWLVGDARAVEPSRSSDAVDAYFRLLDAFGRPSEVGPLAARAVARVALAAPSDQRARLLRRALTLDAGLAVRVGLDRARRRRAASGVAAEAGPWLRSLRSAEASGAPTRVTVVTPEPTPYRSPLFDRVAERPELDLSVIYQATTVADRRWTVEPRHRNVVLRGIPIPFAARLLRHDYPVTPGIYGALRDASAEVVVVTGWSTFASQAAILWSRLRRIPYLLLVSSHDAAPRSGWRRAVKGAVVPWVVRGSDGALVLGTLSRDSLIERGASPERIRIFANTIDVPGWMARSAELAERREELRAAIGAGEDEVVVLSVARLAPEKELDVLIRAVAQTGDPRLAVAIAGHGSEGAALERLAAELGVRLRLVGDVPWERMIELYAASDVFALLSSSEPWGVVVNEAAACGLPLVLSDQVGAAYDLLNDGENGTLVPVGDVMAAAAAFRRLAEDPELRKAQGARSREIMTDWGYEPSVESFVAAIRDATASR